VKRKKSAPPGVPTAETGAELLQLRYELRQAYVVHAVDLERMLGLFKSWKDKTRVVVTRSDGVIQPLAKSEDLLNYPNHSSARIQEVTVSSVDGAGPRRLQIELNSSASQPSIVLSCYDTSEEIERLRRLVITLGQDIRPWYSFISTNRYVSITSALFLIAVGIPLSIAALMAFPSQATGNSNSASNWRWVWFWMFVQALALTSDAIIKRVFPISEFAIGYGKKRYEQRELFRWTVLVGFVVSIAAGLVLLAFV
jgi:hypothetical protein